MPYYGLYIPVKGGVVGATTNGASTTNSSNLSDSVNDANKDNNETGKFSIFLVFFCLNWTFIL